MIKNSLRALILAWLAVPVPVCAQTDTLSEGPVKMLVYENLKNEDVLKQFDQRFEQMDNLLQHTVSIASPNLTLGEDVLSPDAALDSLYRVKGAMEAKAFKRRTGLELTGQVYGRLDDAMVIEHDDDDQYYRGKDAGSCHDDFPSCINYAP